MANFSFNFGAMGSGKKQAKMNARKINGEYDNGIEGQAKVIIDGSDDEVEYFTFCGDYYLKEVMKNSQLSKKLNKYRKQNK